MLPTFCDCVTVDHVATVDHAVTVNHVVTLDHVVTVDDVFTVDHVILGDFTCKNHYFLISGKLPKSILINRIWHKVLYFEFDYNLEPLL